jgi:hypothetical protein
MIVFLLVAMLIENFQEAGEEEGAGAIKEKVPP